MKGRGAWEKGCDLFCFHFVLRSDDRSISELCLLFVSLRSDTGSEDFLRLGGLLDS